MPPIDERPQERQRGFYFVRADSVSPWEVAEWEHYCGKHGWTFQGRRGFSDDYFHGIGPRIPSPDEPASAPIEPDDSLTGTADDQIWSSAEVAAMREIIDPPMGLELLALCDQATSDLRNIAPMGRIEDYHFALAARRSAPLIVSKVVALEAEVLEVRSTALHNFKEFEAANKLMHERIVALEAECARLRVDNKELEGELRQTLWMSHGHQGLYGDDGEIQCNTAGCMIDFKREPLEQIQERLYVQRLKEYSAARKESGQ